MYHPFFVILVFILLIPAKAYSSVSIKSDLVHYYVEEKDPIGIDTAKSLLQSGRFTKTTELSPTFGVNSKPVWIYFQIENKTNLPQQYRLVSSVSWIDYLDFYFENSLGTQTSIISGDRNPGTEHIIPGVGIAFNLDILPGLNQVFFRAESNDPLAFPLSLSPAEDTTNDDRIINLAYGFLYGFLIALIATNLMFYRVLGNDIYLFYSLVVSSFLLINIGYTGQGIYWLWPDYPNFQNYIILVMMVIYSIMLLSFGIRFLDIRNNSPSLYKTIKTYQLAGLIAITASVILHNQPFSDYIAFFYLAISIILLLIISILNVNRVSEGKYFLAAVCLGTLGLLTTDLAVMGIIPFTWLTFHLAEAGITLEASIFALALTRQIKMREKSRIKSERLAKYDPLTNLHNRRSFYDITPTLMNNIKTKKESFSIIMLDVDNFKIINDTHGHNIGDQALKIISQRIKTLLRSSDIAVRWGGEEILIALPNTKLNNAMQLAERVRQAIESNALLVDDLSLNLTISLGVSEIKGEQCIDELVNEADHALLSAKQTGRNKVIAG